MNKPIILSVSIVSIAAVICVLLYCCYNRYELMPPNTGSAVYKLDKLTGEVGCIYINRTVQCEEIESK